MDGEMSMRMAVLHIDRGADLPLVYTYEHSAHEFRTVGYVRLRNITVWETITHRGPDTTGERDAFLRKVLSSLLLPPRQVEGIIRSADHPSEERPSTGTRPVSPPLDSGAAARSGGAGRGQQDERDGSGFAGPGMLLGLFAGLLTGWVLEGWSGAVIGAYVGASTCGDLLMACWQAVHARSPHNYVLMQDTLAVLVVALGSIAGAVGGYVLGDGDFGQARGVFLGMALAAFLLSAVATSFSRIPFGQRSPMWLGPLCIGLTAWGAHTLWSHPVSLVAAVLVGTGLAGMLPVLLGGGAGPTLRVRL